MSKRKPVRRKSELHQEMLSTSVVNPFIDRCSSPRAVMDGSHMGSRPSLIRPEVRETSFEGIEYELGKYIDDVRTEYDCVVKGVIPKLQDKKINPEVSLIVEFEDEKGDLSLDLIRIPLTRSKHTKFGYRLHLTEVITEMGMNGSVIPKDTVLARTDSYDEEDGIYMFGVNANVINMSHIGVGEDGILVSDRFIDKLDYTMVEETVINLTRENLPVNMRGDLNYFKMLPEIGECVGEEGILAVFRNRNDSMSIADLNNKDICRIDHLFDIKCYVEPNSIVTDIRVIKGRNTKPVYSPNMTTQLDHYSEVDLNYYKAIDNLYQRIRNEGKRSFGASYEPTLTYNMHREITDMKALIASVEDRRKLSKRSLDVDQYRIEITTMAIKKATVGNKLTGVHAEKGIISGIIPWQDMPRINGVYADVIIDGSSARASRMNVSGLYEQFIGAVARDNRNRLLDKMYEKHGKNFINKLTDSDYKYVHGYITEMMSYINPDYHEFLLGLSGEKLEDYVYECLDKWIMIPTPSCNEFAIDEVVSCLKQTEFAPIRGKVTYRDDLGREVTTTGETIIGRQYFLLLDKLADEFSAVASPKLNNFMLPVKGGEFDKRKYPHSQTPITNLGETETRVVISNAKPVMIAELYDMATNPTTLKQTYRHMLECDGWFDENFSIDRRHNPYGNGKPVAIVKHVWRGAGVVMDALNDDYVGGNYV